MVVQSSGICDSQQELTGTEDGRPRQLSPPVGEKIGVFFANCRASEACESFRDESADKYNEVKGVKTPCLLTFLISFVLFFCLKAPA